MEGSNILICFLYSILHSAITVSAELIIQRKLYKTEYRSHKKQENGNITKNKIRTNK